MTSRATVTCGCGASAVFEDWLPSTADSMVDRFNKAHASCRSARSVMEDRLDRLIASLPPVPEREVSDEAKARFLDATCDRLYGPCRCGKTHDPTSDGAGLDRGPADHE